MACCTGILETALYVDDLERAKQFYLQVLQFPLLVADDRLCALAVAEKQVLLIFRRGASLAPMPFSGGVIPAHDGSGPVHVAFSISAAELPAWEQRLADHGIPIESKVTWERGGQSLYFRDPDGHVLELATPGIWAIY